MPDIGFNDLINRAARDLPKGWEIVLHVEKESAWVELFDPTGVEHELSSYSERIENDFAELIRVARGEV